MKNLQNLLIAASCPPLSPFFGLMAYNQPMFKKRYLLGTTAYISCHSGPGASSSTCNSAGIWSQPTDCKGNEHLILKHKTKYPNYYNQ